MSSSARGFCNTADGEITHDSTNEVVFVPNEVKTITRDKCIVKYRHVLQSYDIFLKLLTNIQSSCSTYTPA